MDDIDLCRMASGRGSASAQTGATRTVVAQAVGDSSGGRVSVVMPGESVTGDGRLQVPVATTQDVRGGDSVQVTIANGSPVVTGVVGGGDRTRGEVKAANVLADEAKQVADAAATAAADAADAAQTAADSAADVKASVDKALGEVGDALDGIESHFWADDAGVHVASDANDGDAGRNLLLSAVGVLIRMAGTVLGAFTGSGVTVYDEGGTARLSVTASGVALLDDDGNVVSFFAADSVQVGAASGKHVAVGSSGIVLMDGDDILATFMPSAATIGPADAFHASVTASGFGIYNGGTLLSSFTASGCALGANSESAVINMCAGIAAISYASGYFQIATESKPIRIATTGAGPVMLYTDATANKNHGALYAKNNYAGVFCGNGTDTSLGSGGYVAVGMSNGSCYATIRANKLGLLPASGTTQTNVDLSHVVACLYPLTEKSLSYGFKAVRSGPTVTISSGGTSVTVAGNWGSLSLGTLESSWRPKNWVMAQSLYAISPGVYLEVTADGAVTLINGGTSSVTAAVAVTLTYAVNA